MTMCALWLLAALVAAGCGSTSLGEGHAPAPDETGTDAQVDGGLADAQVDARTDGPDRGEEDPAPPFELAAAPGCGPGGLMCGAQCVDPQFDPSHCGACGMACPEGTRCHEGQCGSCPEGHVTCDGRCTDPRTDLRHCGATVGCGEATGRAGEACAAGELCVEAACTRCPLFDAAMPVHHEGYPRAVIDLDGDGYDEILLTTYGPARALSIRSGGQEQVRDQAWPGGNTVVGDLNGDGRDDALGAWSTEIGVQVWLNDGTGVLRAGEVLSPTTYNNASAEPNLIDLDGDGTLDVVMSDATALVVRLFRNTGDAHFELLAELPIPHQYTSIRVGDFDGNGRGDVMTSWGNEPDDGTVVTLAPVPGEAWVSLPVQPELDVRQVMDVDGDGRDDLLDSHGGVQRSRGDGSFEAPTPPHAVWDPEAYLGTSFVRDLDGDGHLDLIASASSTVSVWWGAPGAQFERVSSYLVPERVVAVGNFVGDAALDLWVGSPKSFVIEGRGGRDGFRTAELLAPTHRFPSLYDWNLDGHRDVLAVVAVEHDYWGRLLRGLEVTYGDGTGRFEGEPVRLMSTSGTIDDFLSFGDVDGDGLLDALGVHAEQDRFYLWRGQADRSLGERREVPHECGWRASAHLNDIDDDGDLDIDATAGCALVNDGSGGFTLERDESALEQLPWVEGTKRLDVDDDGILDDVHPLDDQIAFSLRGDDGELANPVPLPGTSLRRYGPLQGAVRRDLDADGLDDLLLLLGDAAHEYVSVSLQRPEGMYAHARVSELTLPASSSYSRYLPPSVGADAADVNGDGVLDLILSRSDKWLLLSRADATYDGLVPIPGCAYTSYFEDLTGDGIADLACRAWPSGLGIYVGLDPAQCGR